MKYLDISKCGVAVFLSVAQVHAPVAAAKRENRKISGDSGCGVMPALLRCTGGAK